LKPAATASFFHVASHEVDSNGATASTCRIQRFRARRYNMLYNLAERILTSSSVASGGGSGNSSPSGRKQLAGMTAGLRIFVASSK
jgi:hypothetical protein